MRETVRVWRLRSHLSALLVVTMLVTFALVGIGIMVTRIPALEDESQRDLQEEVQEMGERLELLLRTGQSRLELLETLLRSAPDEQANTLLDGGMHNRLAFQAVYRVSPQGQVIAAGLPDTLRGKRHDLVGSDMSSNALYRKVATGPGVVWSGRYLSLLTGLRMVGLAIRQNDGHVLIAEVPFAALLDTVKVAAGRQSSSIWVVDRTGDIIVDTEGGRAERRLNIRNWPLMQALLRGDEAPTSFDYGGRALHAAVSHSAALDWYFIGHAPTGLDNPAVRRLVTYLLASFAGCLLTGLLIAPFWASRLARPLQEIVDRARQTTRGEAHSLLWPRGPVAEFNSLSGDLEKMAATLQEREQKSQAIFNAAPVPMAVVNAADDARILDVNEAWCREYVREREQVIGRNARELGIFRSLQEELDLPAQIAERAGRTAAEVRLVRGNGEDMLAQVFGGPAAALKAEQLSIWATVDVGPIRRIEAALRELNLALEERVAQRTEALAASNGELSNTVERLRAAQDQLVRTEKMAALGFLVAGVAHELNTPLGNGVMAVSAMADAARQFKTAMQSGLRRSDLQQLVDSVEQGTDIAGRNLRRAADLVHSFKQVAADRTSAQRRSFELGEVVHEMVVSLRPSFSRTPYRIEVDVPETGLRLDSYPGALGQTIGNLIQNAVVHGFDGRDHGTVRIDAQRAEDSTIVLRVADDGKGIAAENLGRIFEPFMTTKMGRGGTGLGLHISYNAVTNLLGGTLTVQSIVGQGSCFELRLPVQAPDHPPADAESRA